MRVCWNWQTGTFEGRVFRRTGSSPVTRTIGKMLSFHSPAGVAELADALDSGSSGSEAVQVQVLSPAPKIPDARAFGTFCLCNSSHRLLSCARIFPQGEFPPYVAEVFAAVALKTSCSPPIEEARQMPCGLPLC